MNAFVISGVAAAVLLVLVGGVGYAVLTLADVHAGLAETVAVKLPESGVANPVTAVLLNFRAYDTFLEIAVLSLAVIGVWSLAHMPRRRAVEPGLVLQFLVGVLVPFMILLGGYLLWAGSKAPGGAFQAGAVFAAAAVLMMLAGVPLPKAATEGMLRGALVLGLIGFILTGAVLMLAGRSFLEYPPERAHVLIVLMETAAAISIGAVLATAFRGGRPRKRERRP